MATSTAISAQGSIIQISTGTGSAKTISAIVVGNPTVLTATAHGLSNGDVVTLAGLTGVDSASLNGMTAVVQFKTTSTFAIAVDTTGKTITASGTATPVTYTAIANTMDFSGFDGSVADIDVTHLGSAAKEFRPGLIDNGGFQCNFNLDNADAGQLAVRAAQISSTIKLFKLILPNTNVASFSGYVKKFSAAGGVDQMVKSSFDLKITGPVTWA